MELRFLEGVRRRVPGHVPVLQALGSLYTRIGRYEEGLQVDLELTKLRPDSAEHWYNLGCSYALLRETDKAFEALNKAVDLGYCDAEWMRKDEDLESLRNDPRFESLLERMASTPRWESNS